MSEHDAPPDAVIETPDGPKGTGLVPDDPAGDEKDWRYEEIEERLAGARPPRGKRFAAVRLGIGMAPIWNQFRLSSCTAFAILRLIHHLRVVLGLPAPLASFLAQYWWARYIMGGQAATQRDSGATLRSAADATRRYGIAPADTHPYVIERFRDEPPTAATEAALLNQTLAHFRLSDDAATALDAFKDCLNEPRPDGRHGYPVIFGVPVFRDAWKAAAQDPYGTIRYPRDGDVIDGYHAVVGDGYSDRYATKWIFGDNSWGTRWGNGGQFRMQQEYYRDFAFDPWSFRAIEPGA